MGSLEQWVVVLLSGLLFGALAFLFAESPARKSFTSPQAVITRSASLLCGSLGFGMIESFGNRRLLHGGLGLIFLASLIGLTV
jgi:hypothetical protein